MYYLLDTPKVAQASPAPDQPQPEAAYDGGTAVVNVKDSPYDVYIGRVARGYKGSDWANPYRIGPDGDRDEVIAKYRTYLTETRPDLLQRIPELVGKRLGCWCAPESCHGDVLVDLANQFQSGEWMPPEDLSTYPMHVAPVLFTVSQIKEAKMLRSEWETLLEHEKRGKKRSTIVRFVEAKLNAHPLEPRFDEMMQALDACTVQSVDDPGMAKTFATFIRTKLWVDRENYYTPEDLQAFAKDRPKVENVYWLVGELSKWRQSKKNTKKGQGDSDAKPESGAGTDTGDEDDWWRTKLGRTKNPIIPTTELARLVRQMQ